MKEKTIPYVKAAAVYASAVAVLLSFVTYSNSQSEAIDTFIISEPTVYIEEPTKEHFYGQKQIQEDLNRKLQFEQ